MIPVLSADKDDQNPYHQQDQKDAQETSQLMLTDFLPIILLNLLPLFFFLFKTSYICHNSSIVCFIGSASPTVQSLFLRDFVVGLSHYSSHAPFAKPSTEGFTALSALSASCKLTIKIVNVEFASYNFGTAQCIRTL